MLPVVAELSRALATAVEAATRGRVMLLEECARAEGPRGSGGHCPADDEVELAIRQILLTAFPNWGFLGEETGAQLAAPGESHVWIVDPNDGTSWMQRGYRGHAVSIAAVRDGLPVLGVVYAVDAPDDAGDLFTWADGCGPLLRNGTPHGAIDWPAELGAEDVVLVSEGANGRPLGNLAAIAPARFIGVSSIAYRLALAAAGEGVVAVSMNTPTSWDFAGGHALLRGAGGVLVDNRCREVRYGSDGGAGAFAVFGGGEAVARQLAGRDWGAIGRPDERSVAAPSGLGPVRAEPRKVVHDVSRLSRAQGCLLGQLAGDSLGALVEFATAHDIARRYSDGGPRLLAPGGPWKITAGQPTDDSEMALLLARTLITHPSYEQEAAAAAYARWFHGWTHPDSLEPCAHRGCPPFDFGSTTRRALGAIDAAAVQAHQAAATAQESANPESQANGALMRASPVGIWGASRDPAEVAAAARRDAQLTHPHPVCQDASAVYTVAIAAAIRDALGPAQTHSYAVEWGEANAIESSVLGVLRQAASGPPSDFQTQQGWVLIALQNAFFQLLDANTLETGVVATVRSGGDTDTNAAICGALLGAVHGRRAIPAQWQRMILSCRPAPGLSGFAKPRPAMFWPTDALILAERLLASGTP
jgi:ADP-ribosyl-[dinitrogen reductase] hydrolase